MDMISLIRKIHGTSLIYSYIFKPLQLFLIKIDTTKYTYIDKFGLITSANCDFLNESEFVSALSARTKQNPQLSTRKWDLHINQWAVNQAKNLSGDFVECGVFKGSLARFNLTLLNFNELKDKKYYLFDTYSGFDMNVTTKEESSIFKGHYDYDYYDYVKDSFKFYPNVIVIKGTVPYSLSTVNIKKVAYLSIDMNCVIPEVEALKYFWPKLVSGGIVVLDDYGWLTQLKKAHDDFAKSVGLTILTLPTGQGILIKP